MTLALPFTYGIEHAVINGKPIDAALGQAITGASYEAGFDTASTVTISINDPERILVNQFTPYTRATLQIGPGWFVLVKVSKSGPAVTLTFEDLVINALRQVPAGVTAGKGKVLKMQRSRITRAGFARRLALDPLAQRYLVAPGQQIAFWSPEFASGSLPSTTTGRKPPPGQPVVKPGDATSTKNVPPASTPDGQLFDPKANLVITDDTPQRNKVYPTKNMKENCAICLSTARRMSPAPDHTVLLSMVETLIVESKMKNLSPSQSDPGSRSRGLFQQQVGPGFSWHGGTNRELATQEYVAAAITIHAKYPTLDAGQIAAQVQRPSANYNGEDLRLRYGHHAAEAERWLDAWQGQPAMPPKDGSGSPDTKKTKQTRKTSTSQGYEFSRSATQTNWDAIKQLADDVRWRAYSDGVVIMFIDDLTLLKLPVKASFREGASGGLKGWTTADWIDFDHDVGKRVQTATVTVAPSLIPFGVAVGSVVMLDSVGLGSGIYLVSDIQLDFWSSTATLQVVRPQQPLPEPPDPSKPSSKTKQQKQDTKDASYDHGSAGERAVAWAAQFLGKPYHYGGGHSFKAGWGAAKTYGDQQLKAYTTGFDCSSFVRCAWAQEGVDVGTYTDNQVSQARLQGIPSGSGRLPKGGWIAGDLVFPYYDANGSTKYDHVVMMTGKGNQAIEAPYTGANIRYRDMGPAAPPFWCRWFGASK